MDADWRVDREHFLSRYRRFRQSRSKRGVWRAIGGILFLLGNGVAWWGCAVLGAKSTLGLTGGLITDGPYRFTRNPQYIGDILIAVGFVLIVNSWQVFWPSPAPPSHHSPKNRGSLHAMARPTPLIDAMFRVSSDRSDNFPAAPLNL